jgi:hypothetical protein
VPLALLNVPNTQVTRGIEMDRTRLPALALALGMLLAPLSGCSVAAKQAFYTVVGAGGKFYETSVVNPRLLATYRSIRVDPFTNELGQRVPPEVIAEVNERTPEVIAESALFYPEGKLLRVTGRIIHYTGRSGLQGSVMSVVGSAEECVCRVQLLDGDSGDLVGEAVCWGTVKSALRRGSEELGTGVGKGVCKWIRERLPEDEKERRHAELGGEEEKKKEKEEEEHK